MSQESSHVSSALFLRGFLVMMFASIAVRWPDETLDPAMMAAGIVMIGFAVFELLGTDVTRKSARLGAFVRADALLAISFGVLSVMAATLNVQGLTAGAAAWLLAQSTVALWLAPRVRAIQRAQSLLLFWSAANLVCAFAAAAYGRPSTTGLLYFGAVYAWGYAAAQIAAAMWLRRHAQGLAAIAGGQPRTQSQ